MVATIGSGIIRTDLMIKILRLSFVAEMAVVALSKQMDLIENSGRLARARRYPEFINQPAGFVISSHHPKSSAPW